VKPVSVVKRLRSRSRGFVSSKIKQYMMGILLLALAGFILGAINYIISIVPEVTIPPSTPTSTETLVKTVSSPSLQGYDGNVGGYYANYEIGLSAPSNNQVYKIVITKPSSSLMRIDIYDGSTWNNGVAYTDNGTHIIIDNWNKAVQTVRVYTSQQETVTVYVYTVSTVPTSPSISNKTILGFISWVAGIILVITALHKLDIWI
jgi:hypothetical protein